MKARRRSCMQRGKVKILWQKSPYFKRHQSGIPTECPGRHSINGQQRVVSMGEASLVSGRFAFRASQPAAGTFNGLELRMQACYASSRWP